MFITSKALYQICQLDMLEKLRNSDTAATRTHGWKKMFASSLRYVFLQVPISCNSRIYQISWCIVLFQARYRTALVISSPRCKNQRCEIDSMQPATIVFSFHLEPKTINSRRDGSYSFLLRTREQKFPQNFFQVQQEMVSSTSASRT